MIRTQPISLLKLFLLYKWESFMIIRVSLLFNSTSGYKGLVLCRNNGWIMENMDKGVTVSKWVLIVRPKIAQMPQILPAQFVCPSPKVLDFNEKRLHLAFVVRALIQNRESLTWIESSWHIYCWLKWFSRSKK